MSGTSEQLFGTSERGPEHPTISPELPTILPELSENSQELHLDILFHLLPLVLSFPEASLHLWLTS